MTKSSEFITAFSALNDQIVSAIADRSFGRVILLDKASGNDAGSLLVR